MAMYTIKVSDKRAILDLTKSELRCLRNGLLANYFQDTKTKAGIMAKVETEFEMLCPPHRVPDDPSTPTE